MTGHDGGAAQPGAAADALQRPLMRRSCFRQRLSARVRLPKEEMMARISTSEKVPKHMQDTFTAMVALTDNFCKAHLDEEYAHLARQAIAALCRQRPSPLATGHLQTWACGIVYALGFVNFLFDRSQTPSLSAAELCTGFGVSKSTGAAKAKAVREALAMGQMDPRWYRPSKMEDNPLAWMITVNGLIMDARHMPRDIQEVAYEKGLIPSLPEQRPRRR
jgi:hypothetical protein